MKKYIKPTSPKKSNTSQPKKNEPSKIKKKKEKIQSEGITKQRIFKSQKITPTKTNTLKEIVIRKKEKIK